MSKAWTYQKADDVRNQGEDAAQWYVGWIDPDGRRKAKSCGAGPQGKKLAGRLASKITAQLMTGTYEQKTTVLWDDFVNEYDRRILSGLSPRSRDAARTCLAHFKRIARPVRVYGINTSDVDEYVAARRRQGGKKKGDPLSPATINKELRHLKAALSVAVDWGYLTKLPRFRMERTAKKLVRYVTPEHFALIYRSCDTAKVPRGLPYDPADWWRGLIVFAYMTGWRISDMLALRREDLDLATGHAITRAIDNKGNRDDRIKLPDVVVDHLRHLASFEVCVFPWALSDKTLHEHFDRIQVAAGIHLACPSRHEHTPSCHTYGFHDLRRAFATMNAARLTPDALQALMRHKSYLTTQVYINIASQLADAAAKLYVPDVLRQRDCVPGVSQGGS